VYTHSLFIQKPQICSSFPIFKIIAYFKILGLLSAFLSSSSSFILISYICMIMIIILVTHSSQTRTQSQRDTDVDIMSDEDISYSSSCSTITTTTSTSTATSATNSPSNSPQKKRRRKKILKEAGEIWQKHTTGYDENNDTQTAVCVYCGKTWEKQGTSTGNLWRHMNNKHNIFPTTIINQTSSTSETFTKESFRQALTKWIVAESLPFTAVESSTFVSLVNLLRPRTEIVSADTIKNAIMSSYEVQKNKIKEDLKNNSSKLSFALDAWTSPNQKAFLGITVSLSHL
jgi:hypothetical protein